MYRATALTAPAVIGMPAEIRNVIVFPVSASAFGTVRIAGALETCDELVIVLLVVSAIALLAKASGRIGETGVPEHAIVRIDTTNISASVIRFMT